MQASADSVDFTLLNRNPRTKLGPNKNVLKSSFKELQFLELLYKHP